MGSWTERVIITSRAGNPPPGKKPSKLTISPMVVPVHVTPSTTSVIFLHCQRGVHTAWQSTLQGECQISSSHSGELSFWSCLSSPRSRLKHQKSSGNVSGPRFLGRLLFLHAVLWLGYAVLTSVSASFAPLASSRFSRGRSCVGLSTCALAVPRAESTRPRPPMEAVQYRSSS